MFELSHFYSRTKSRNVLSANCNCWSRPEVTRDACIFFPCGNLVAVDTGYYVGVQSWRYVGRETFVGRTNERKRTLLFVSIVSPLIFFHPRYSSLQTFSCIYSTARFADAGLIYPANCLIVPYHDPRNGNPIWDRSINARFPRPCNHRSTKRWLCFAPKPNVKKTNV